MNKSEALQQRKKLIQLLEQQTRAEIMARLRMDIRFPEDADYWQAKLDKIDEMRELIFGTSDILELGYRWNLLKREEDKDKKRRKEKRRKRKEK